MIQDLIEGIACYCDTEDQYYALENLCYQFSDDYHKWMKNLNKVKVQLVKMIKQLIYIIE
jgi:hypothetical protein